MVVIAIVAVFAAASDAVYARYAAASNLEIASMSLVSALRYARSNAQAVVGDSGWGVKLLPGEAVVFRGGDYASRDASSDMSVDFPRGIRTSGRDEFAFGKLSGDPSSGGTVTISNSGGLKTIDVNAKGTVSY